MKKLLTITAVFGILLTAPCVATVNIVVRTYDGIVVAADSRVTLQDGKMTRIASDYGEKVKRVGNNVAVVFSGTAYLYNTDGNLRNIGSIVDLYKSQSGIADSSRTDPNVVAQGIDSLLRNIYNRYQKLNIDRGELQLLICGYDTLGERRIYELTYPRLHESASTDRKYDVIGLFDSILVSGVPAVLVRGQTDVWTRLVKGYDPQLLSDKLYKDVDSIIIDSLDSAKVDTVKVRKPIDLDDFRYDIRYDLMTLQDAIDFSVFIIRATIEAQRFNQASVQGVGGAIDIAVITTDGFRWIQRKQLHGEDPFNKE